jgi:hypothetical protein
MMADRVNLADVQADMISIGDKLLITGTRDYSPAMGVLLTTTVQAEALSYAQAVQQQLFNASIATIRTSVNGVELDTFHYQFTVELEVIDIVNPTTGQSTLGQTPSFQTNQDGSQVAVAGSINIGTQTLSAWEVVSIALLAVVASVELYNQAVFVERANFPGVAAPPYVTSPVSDISGAFTAAAVFMAFYFLSKVVR